VTLDDGSPRLRARLYVAATLVALALLAALRWWSHARHGG
jgi:hypothetical protein